MYIVFVSIQLVLGAAAAFLAIMLWAKTRDVAWMLIVLGTITAYIEILYPILLRFGVWAQLESFESKFPYLWNGAAVVRTLFFIAAFLVMIMRRRKA